MPYNSTTMHSRTNLPQGAQQEVGSGFGGKLTGFQVHVDHLQPCSVNVHLADKPQAPASGAGDYLLVDKLRASKEDVVCWRCILPGNGWWVLLHKGLRLQKLLLGRLRRGVGWG